MAIRKHIPNAITCLNLLSGSLAVVYTLYPEGDMSIAVWLIVLAAVFDFFDGLVARALGVSSPIGKDLDSLADVVSFGLAPALLMLATLMREGFSLLVAAPVLLIVAFAALRLAHFNHDTRQTTSFIGLPVPAGALFWVGIYSLIPEAHVLLGDNMLIGGVYVLVALMCYMGMSELPMFSFKIGGDQGKAYQIALVLIALTSMGLLGLPGCAITILAYILLSTLRAYSPR